MKYLVSLFLFIVLASCSSGSGGGEEVSTNSSASPAPTTTSSDVSNLVIPANSSYGENASLYFQITWDETVTVTGTPRIPLDIGGVTKYADYLSGSGSSTLNFSYTVAAGENDTNGIGVVPALDLNGGNITPATSDSASLDFSALLGSTTGILVDTTITPPSQVTNLSTAPTTVSTSLAVSWSVPSDNGTAITNYILQYRVQGETNWSTHSPNPTSNSSTISNLTANTTYEFRVAASNGVLGSYSNTHQAEIFDIMGFSPIAWLDATDINADGSSVNDGDQVATWVDKTGSAGNAEESDPAKQPVFEANKQNGLGAVRFDELDRGLSAEFTRVNGTSLTIFIVGQFGSETDRCMFEFIGPGNARAFFIDRRYAGNNYYSPNLTKQSFNLWRVENAGATATVTENSSTTLFSGALTFNTDFVGTGDYFLGDDSTGGNRLNGYIGEILIFDTTLSSDEINKIEDYLKNKWGL